MIIEEYFVYMSQYGFPIVMCFYLMFRHEKVIDKNTGAIDKLTEVIKNGNKK